MSISKVIVIVIYLIFVSFSIFNVYSYIPYYGMGAQVEKKIGANYQIFFELLNKSEANWEDVVVMLNDNYIVTRDKIESKSTDSVYSLEFLPINYRPEKASFTTVKKSLTREELIKKISTEIDKKVELKIYKKGDYFYTKIQ